MFRRCLWLPVALSMGACTAPLVESGVDKFHSGSVHANALLARDVNDVLSVGRFTSTMAALNPTSVRRVGPADVGMEDKPSPGDFATYVCMRSTKFAFQKSRQDSLVKVDPKDKKSHNTPQTPEEFAKEVQTNFDECYKEVIAYVTLRQDQLPRIGVVASPSRGVPWALTPASAAAGIALIGSVINVLKTVYDGIQAEVRASQIKAVVIRPDVQRTVLTALEDLSRPDPELGAYCASAGPICRRLRPQDDNKDEQSHYEIVGAPDVSNNVCGSLNYVNVDSEEYKKRSITEKEQKKKTFIALDNATIYKRWIALRLAYYRYNDLLRYRAYAFTVRRGQALLPEFETRRVALDGAVAQYAAIQSTADIVSDQKQAWATLTAVSCGKLTAKQLFEAMSAFASRMTGIADAYKKVGEAKTNYDKAIAPPEDDE